jgi:hypothetical protein
MIEGKEPMRTFGDLMQFMKVKQAPEPGDTSAQRKNGNAAATASAGSAPTAAGTPPSLPATEAPEPESSAAEAPSSAASETQQRMAAVPAPHSVSHSEHAAQPAVESQAGQPTIP